MKFPTSTPKLEIEFTRSYGGFLDARVSLSCCIGKYLEMDDLAIMSPALRGWWSQPHTMPDTVTWTGDGGWVEDGHGSYSQRVFDGCNCAPGVVYTLSVVVQPLPEVQVEHLLAEPPAQGTSSVDWHFKLLSITTC